MSKKPWSTGVWRKVITDESGVHLNLLCPRMLSPVRDKSTSILCKIFLSTIEYFVAYLDDEQLSTYLNVLGVQYGSIESRRKPSFLTETFCQHVIYKSHLVCRWHVSSVLWNVEGTLVLLKTSINILRWTKACLKGTSYKHNSLNQKNWLHVTF